MTVKNMCTTMVLSGRMSNEALSNDFRTPLIEQYITIYHEDVVDFEEAAEEVKQAMMRLDKLQEEEEEQAKCEGLGGGARAGKELTGAQSAQRSPAKRAALERWPRVPPGNRARKWTIAKGR